MGQARGDAGSHGAEVPSRQAGVQISNEVSSREMMLVKDSNELHKES